MERKLRELSDTELKKLPRSSLPAWIGKEIIYMHCANSKKIHWYFAEYDPINRSLFGFNIGGSDGISSGWYALQDLLNYEKKGVAWEVTVDGNWSPTLAEDIPQIKGYIQMMRSLQENF
jgi:hypothetical protein